MKAYKVNVGDMERALAIVNEKYEGNITWKRFDVHRNHINFTLTVRSTKALGFRRGFQGQKVAAACWHVHGDFFDALLEIQPEAKVKALNRTIDINGGNWKDWQVGSRINPLMYSQACDC